MKSHILSILLAFTVFSANSQAVTTRGDKVEVHDIENPPHAEIPGIIN